jgi:serine/threonine protein phosphatase 1
MTHVSELALDESRFAKLVSASRVWAVAAIHGQVDRLAALHSQLAHKFAPGDRLVYLGNYIGVGQDARETVTELLRMRRRLLAQAGRFEAVDFVYLRGAQEEMWSKLLQLQFAPNPPEILEWLLDHGVGPTIEAYGSTLAAARGHVRDGPLAITKWTNALRTAMHRNPGHHEFMASLKRAALTEDGSLLFVHASVDPSRPLTMQGDIFWWDTGAFDQLSEPFSGFRKVVRGYDHRHRGVDMTNPHAITIDGGCGFGGPLIALCVLPDGSVADRIEA